MAVPGQTPWKEDFVTTNLFDNTLLIKKWYEKSENPVDNPYQLIDLNDRMKVLFTFLKEQLKNMNSQQITHIVDTLKIYYKSQPEKSQKSDLIFIDLLIETERQAQLLQPGFQLNLSDNFMETLKKFMPQFVEHFKVEKLAILNFQAHMNATFLGELRKIVTIDALENLDKASISEQEKGGNIFKFQYESQLEYLYIQIIIKIVESNPIDFGPIMNWFSNYPFRMLNKNGLTTPDNFYLSASSYIHLFNTNVEIAYKQLKLRNLVFFHKLKQVRAIPAQHIETQSDFLDAYDNSVSELTIDKQVITSDIPMRSIYFREDFDYLNSLNIRGLNLNRAFWIRLDEKIAPKSLGPYIKATSSVRNLDEFFDLIKSELRLDDSFVQKMKYEIYKQRNLCVSEEETVEAIEAVEDQSKSEKTLANLPNITYSKLNFEGATPLRLTMKTYRPEKDLVDYEESVNKLIKTVKMPNSENSKVIKIVNYKDMNLNSPNSEPILYTILNFQVAADVDMSLINDKIYEAIFHISFGLETKKTRTFLQLEEEEISSITEDIDMVNVVANLEEETREFTNSLNTSAMNQRGGDLKQKPTERFFHKVIFISIASDRRQYIELEFDVNNMKKQNLFDLIKQIVSERKVTYYKLYFSMATKEDKIKFPTFPDDNHDKIMSDIKANEAFLASKITEMYEILETKRIQAMEKLNTLKKAEEMAYAKRAYEDKSRFEEILRLKNELEANYEKAKIEVETTIAEGQAHLDAALEKEQISKKKLEAMKVAKTLEDEDAEHKAAEEAEAEEQRLENELEQKKKNNKTVAGYKSALSRLMSDIKKFCIDVLEIQIIEDNKNLEKFKEKKGNNDKVSAIEMQIKNKLEFKSTLESFVKYDFKADTPIKQVYDDYVKALEKYNQPFVIKTRSSENPEQPIKDVSFDKYKTAYRKLLENLTENKTQILDMLSKIQPIEIPYVEERHSTRPRRPSKRCEEEGYGDSEKGWCYKKNSKKKPTVVLNDADVSVINPLPNSVKASINLTDDIASKSFSGNKPIGTDGEESHNDAVARAIAEAISDVKAGKKTKK